MPGLPRPRAAAPICTPYSREALAVAESDVRLFDRPDETDGHRRLGVALATAPDPIIARDRARRVSTALRKLW